MSNIYITKNINKKFDKTISAHSVDQYLVDL